MYLGGTYRSQVAPGDRVQKVRVKEIWALKNKVRVEVKDLKEEDNVWGEQVTSRIVKDKVLVPLGKIHTFDSQIVHLSAHWQ